ESAGVKFADADLIGIPWRIVVSEKTLASGSVELKARSAEGTELVILNQIAGRLKEETMRGDRRT
ncbi:proline--tRNA ligase, partial [Candidatus Parcubacteria bacterium]|nr:proline--tRNA ligase [Candidatus Parcubacteria bacterium]